jgi:hypothetical protein
MGISEDIARVATEFVPGEAVFNAVQRQEGVSAYQAASWFMRHIEELDRLPMYAFSPELQDFYTIENPWTSDLMADTLFGREGADAGASPGEHVWVDDDPRGYRAGWLRSDLEKFFASTSVAMPPLSGVSEADNVLKPLLESDLPTAESASSSEDSVEVLGTKERTTLLCIIGTLAREARFDISRPSKAAGVLVNSAAATGVRISQRSVEEWLKKVPEALERRST